ncbi:MAG: hypothetical protein O2966_05420 [Proteobacteria bacterium]|nr:hypothetical protein [Pseudomonadota bacterium]
MAKIAVFAVTLVRSGNRLLIRFYEGLISVRLEPVGRLYVLRQVQHERSQHLKAG